VTTFSPQGRLFQAEYAMEAVKQGSAAVGATSDTHAVLAAIKRCVAAQARRQRAARAQPRPRFHSPRRRPPAPSSRACSSPGELASFQQKIFRVDDHMGIALSGLTSDGRSLCRYMRGEALNHRYVYGSPVQAERLVADVADKHQRATWSYVRRPYGVGLLVAAYDVRGARARARRAEALRRRECGPAARHPLPPPPPPSSSRRQRTGPHLLQTAPDGNYYEWRAMALGARSQSAKTYLERNFRSFPSLARDELIRHAVRALNSCTEADKELTIDNCVIAVVGKDEAFHMLQGAAVAPFLVGLEAPPRAATQAEAAERMPVEGEDATSAASLAPAAGGGEAGPAPMEG